MSAYPKSRRLYEFLCPPQKRLERFWCQGRTDRFGVEINFLAIHLVQQTRLALLKTPARGRVESGYCSPHTLAVAEICEKNRQMHEYRQASSVNVHLYTLYKSLYVVQTTIFLSNSLSIHKYHIDITQILCVCYKVLSQLVPTGSCQFPKYSIFWKAAQGFHQVSNKKYQIGIHTMNHNKLSRWWFEVV